MGKFKNKKHLCGVFFKKKYLTDIDKKGIISPSMGEFT